MKPILIEVVAPLLTAQSFNCRRCNPIFEEAGLKNLYVDACNDEYPEEWKEELEGISDWVSRAGDLYKHRIMIRMIDAQSPLGLWKKIRHRFSGMPAFIVDGIRVHTGLNTERLEEIIDERIREESVRLARSS